MKVIVIIPTYNEKENISKLLNVLDDEFAKHNNHDFHALIVDDNSPDGTSDVVKSLMEKYQWLHLLTREGKAGLGSAYIAGFNHVLQGFEADAVVEMDADFQHDPKDLIRFVKEIEKGADYVVGSRFLEGSAIPKEWALYRKFLSIGGSLFTKIVLGMFKQTDFTTGFKATRVKGFLDKLNFEEVLSTGFAYKIDLLYKMYKMGANIVEIPIIFGLRDRGNSKMERNNFIDSLKVVLTIRARESKSFLKFATVGLVGFVIDTGLFNVLRSTVLSSGISSAVSGAIALVTTFLLNNSWSFNDRKMETWGTKLKKFPFFAVSSYIPIIFRSWLVSYVAENVSDSFLWANGTFVFGVAVGLVWNFTIYSRIIWKVTND